MNRYMYVMLMGGVFVENTHQETTKFPELIGDGNLLLFQITFVQFHNYQGITSQDFTFPPSVTWNLPKLISLF
jgi:hypothetical protein